MVSFDNTKIAFSHKPTFSLRRARWLFRAMENQMLVKMGNTFSGMAMRMGLPIKGMVKATLFKQFCGGETIDECDDDIELLGKYGIGAILDYSVEGKEKEEAFEATAKEVLRTQEKAAAHADIPFCVFKITGLARFSLLEKASHGTAFTEGEKEEYERFRSRVDRICRSAHEKNLPLFIDAEESWYQKSIDDLAREMMEQYNRETPIVYNTLQFYRWDRLDFLKEETKKARENGYYLGIKLVRGAYLEKERNRAREMGYQDPIQPDKTATDRDYDEALRFCIDNIDRIHFCAGTHNEASCHHLMDLMDQRDIRPDDTRIYFSQLMGMSDNISFNLAKAGYKVAKYIPYGPVKEVLPYLMRRAEENSAVAGQSGRELSLIDKELERRKKAE